MQYFHHDKPLLSRNNVIMNQSVNSFKAVEVVWESLFTTLKSSFFSRLLIVLWKLVGFLSSELNGMNFMSPQILIDIFNRRQVRRRQLTWHSVYSNFHKNKLYLRFRSINGCGCGPHWLFAEWFGIPDFSRCLSHFVFSITFFFFLFDYFNKTVDNSFVPIHHFCQQQPKHYHTVIEHKVEMPIKWFLQVLSND